MAKSKVRKASKTSTKVTKDSKEDNQNDTSKTLPKMLLVLTKEFHQKTLPKVQRKRNQLM